MELSQTQVIAIAVFAILGLLTMRRGRGLLRLIVLFGVATALTLGVEWLVAVGIRTVYPQVLGTGLFEGMQRYALVPAVLVGLFVTFTSWREGV